MESFNNLFESPLVSVDGFAKATKAILDEVRAELDTAPALDLADVNVEYVVCCRTIFKNKPLNYNYEFRQLRRFEI
jgi:hypothetical protein